MWVPKLGVSKIDKLCPNRSRIVPADVLKTSCSENSKIF